MDKSEADDFNLTIRRRSILGPRRSEELLSIKPDRSRSEHYVLGSDRDEKMPPTLTSIAIHRCDRRVALQIDPKAKIAYERSARRPFRLRRLLFRACHKLHRQERRAELRIEIETIDTSERRRMFDLEVDPHALGKVARATSIC